jgi:hypothetical protein
MSDPLFDRASPWGFDRYVGPTVNGSDMLPNGRGCSDVELVANKILARSLCGTLPLIGAPGGVIDFGEPVQEWVGEALTAASLAQKQTRLTLVYQRIRAIDPATLAVTVSQTGPAGAQCNFYITVSARLLSGQPIALVMGINAVSVDLLSQGT